MYLHKYIHLSWTDLYTVCTKKTTVIYFFKFYVYVPVMINVVIACILYEGLINQYVLYVVRVTYLYYLFMFAAWGKLNTTVSRKGTCTYRYSPNHRTCFFCIVVLTLLCGARDIDLNANNGLVLLPSITTTLNMRILIKPHKYIVYNIHIAPCR